MSDGTLGNCGCCGGQGAGDRPATTRNRPGLPSLAYRIGTHSHFFERMKRCLSAQPELRRLTARTLEDPTIALLDAWAVSLDVLTFYQERFANEGYLRTAVERRSVLELARAIGYELDPGVAASVALAFDLETGDGAPPRARLDVGIQVLSIPGQDERPQTFETVEGLEAKPQWNRLVPLQDRVQDAGREASVLLFSGLDTRLALGDPLLLVGRSAPAGHRTPPWDLRFVSAIELDRQRGQTRVTWRAGRPGNGRVFATGDYPRVFALRQRAAPFGHNAPDWRAMAESIKLEYADTDDPRTLPSDWPRFDLPVTDPPVVHLDAPYPKIVAGSWLVLHKPPLIELFRVMTANASSQTDFTLTSQTRQVVLDGQGFRPFAPFRRQTVALAESEELTLAAEPIATPVQGRHIRVVGDVEGLEAGRRLLVRGVETSADGEPPPPGRPPVSEEVRLETIHRGAGSSTLVLEQGLQRSYLRPSVEIFANVVLATHGETVEQVLGSGDAASADQRFSLQRSPLTYVSATTASGAASTLEVRVNEVLWRPVESFFGEDAGSESYIVRHDDDGGTLIQTGDGARGARLPTGSENIRARFRTGLGLAGAVGADRLTLLRTRPLGVRQVTNPLPASGAADPESLTDARSNAPRTVLTLDRVVSRQDFEDFARSFAGIAKARADVLWLGQRRQIQLTLAAAQGHTVAADSELAGNLRRALEGVKDPAQAVDLAGYEPLTFDVTARVAVDDRYLQDDVFAAIRQGLARAFDFAHRAFGQPVTASEIVAQIQGIEGVVAVDLDHLTLTSAALFRRSSPAFLAAQPARHVSRGAAGSVVLPAQLLTLAALRLLPLDLRTEGTP